MIEILPKILLLLCPLNVTLARKVLKFEIFSCYLFSG